jgi:hypothetical protein
LHNCVGNSTEENFNDWTTTSHLTKYSPWLDLARELSLLEQGSDSLKKEREAIPFLKRLLVCSSFLGLYVILENSYNQIILDLFYMNSFLELLFASSNDWTNGYASSNTFKIEWRRENVENGLHPAGMHFALTCN